MNGFHTIEGFSDDVTRLAVNHLNFAQLTQKTNQKRNILNLLIILRAMKQKRSFLLGFISVLLLVLLLELVARLALFVMGFPFWTPGQAFTKKFYPELQKIIDTPITANDGYRDVLILGGSAISSEFSQMDSRLQKMLNADSAKNQPKVRVFNVAHPSHTSLDNLKKYQYLADKHFDLVIYYEAINENRANLVAKQNFRPDYQHILWYYDLALVEKHPEMSFTVLPYLIEKGVGLAIKKLGGQTILNREAMYPEQNAFGANIKTLETYTHNLAQMVALAKQRGAKFLPVTYAMYFPKSVAEKGMESNYDDFAPCRYPSPLILWGNPINVHKGVQQHNAALRRIASANALTLCDMDSLMPRQKSYYCDLCHLTPEGIAVFAGILGKSVTF
jgi:hypothetical protein